MQHNRSASEIATGRWRYILTALGLDESYLRNRHGPCPMCGGKDRWRFDDKEGRGTWFCNQCGNGDGYALLQRFHGWNFAEALKEVRQIVGDAPIVQPKPECDEQQKIALIRRTWEESLPVEKGDPVWTYLNRRTGIKTVPSCIRFHPALPYFDDRGEITRYPAMLAPVTYPNGKVATLHRTYLTSEGCKANVPSPKKLMPGKPLQAASIKLGGYQGALGVAEGIETAFAAAQRFSVTVWSCVSAALLETWQPPEDAGKIIIFGDNDPKFGGQASAFRLAHRLACDKRQVIVRIPDESGKDWADAITRPSEG